MVHAKGSFQLSKTEALQRVLWSRPSPASSASTARSASRKSRRYCASAQRSNHPDRASGCNGRARMALHEGNDWEHLCMRHCLTFGRRAPQQSVGQVEIGCHPAAGPIQQSLDMCCDQPRHELVDGPALLSVFSLLCATGGSRERGAEASVFLLSADSYTAFGLIFLAVLAGVAVRKPIRELVGRPGAARRSHRLLIAQAKI
jgi:hypothetical protein